MEDLEITRLAAEAMGIKVWESPIRGTIMRHWFMSAGHPSVQTEYNPLHDDAQAMALVKKFGMRIAEPSSDHWRAAIPNPQIGLDHTSDEQDLNRAICLCVAKMQKAKHG